MGVSQQYITWGENVACHSVNRGKNLWTSPSPSKVLFWNPNGKTCWASTARWRQPEEKEPFPPVPNFTYLLGKACQGAVCADGEKAGGKEQPAALALTHDTDDWLVISALIRCVNAPSTLRSGDLISSLGLNNLIRSLKNVRGKKI